MTKEEAIQAMKDGKKVTHRYFTDDEYIFINEKGDIQTEDGAKVDPDEFWKYRQQIAFNEDWELFTPPVKLRATDENEIDFDPCADCDLPDACADFGCAIRGGVKKQTGI